MKSNSLIKIDHFNPGSRKKILSSQPLLSSQDLGWDGMVFNHHFYANYGTPEHIQINHNVGIYLSDIYKEEKLNGKLISTNQSYGFLTILPHGHRYSSAWQDELEFLVLSIKPEKLAEFAPESIEPISIELLPCLNSEPDHLITGILLHFMQEIAEGVEANDPLIENFQNALLAHLLQNYCSKRFKLKKHNGLPSQKLKLALDYINDNLHHKITLADIAKELDVSSGYFGRLFKESMEISPHQYILHRRVEKAQLLLKNNLANLSLQEIAIQSGFKSVSHFNRRFCQVTGVNLEAYCKFL